MSNPQANEAQTTLPTDQELVMKVIPMPADCNANGDIFGGWVMAQVDLAGAVLPARLVQGRMATVAVNEFIFKQPVRVGDILSFFSKVTRIGRTSVTVRSTVSLPSACASSSIKPRAGIRSRHSGQMATGDPSRTWTAPIATRRSRSPSPSAISRSVKEAGMPPGASF